MLWKLLTLLGVALAVWSMIGRLLPRPAPAPEERRAQVEDLRRCSRCGAWGPEGESCDCRTPPVP